MVRSAPHPDGILPLADLPPHDLVFQESCHHAERQPRAPEHARNFRTCTSLAVLEPDAGHAAPIAQCIRRARRVRRIHQPGIHRRHSNIAQPPGEGLRMANKMVP